MREPYKDAFNSVLSNITIVVDRFHFVRYIILALDKIRIRVMKTYSTESIQYSDINDNIAYLKIYHNGWNCKMTEKKIINLMTSYSSDLKIAYDFLHYFMVSYKKWNYETAKIKLKQLIEFLNFHKEISELNDLGKLLTNWKTEIENSFLIVDDRTINNAICEGINRKIKSLKNISFGITNFNHLRNRVFLIYKNFDLNDANSDNIN